MMKFIKINLLNFLFITFLMIVPFISLAQNAPTPSGPNAPTPSAPIAKITNPLSVDTIDAFILKILEGVIKIAIPIVALAVIYCGFLFVSARGNSEKLTKAKDALLYTLIGAAILLGALAIAELLKDTVLSLG